MRVKKIMSGYIFRAFKEKEFYIMFLLNLLGSVGMIAITFSAEYPQNNIDLVYYSFVIPAANAAVFVLMHENALFAGGTVNNLITTGHTKRSVYIAHLLMALAADILFMLVFYLCFLISQVISGRFLKISIGSLALVALLSLMISFVIMAITVASHFISRRAVAALIVTGALVFGLNAVSIGVAESAILMPVHEIDYDSPQMQLVKRALAEDQTRVDWQIDPFTLEDHVYLDGTEINIYSKKVNPEAIRGTKRKVLISVMQSMPLTHPFISYSTVLSTADNAAEANTAYLLFGIGVDLAWFAVITAGGAFIFKKSNLK